jgi:xylan 1,4-beta-xylosidase
LPAQDAAPVTLTLTHLKPGDYRLQVHRTGYHSNDPYSTYIEMGAPKTLSATETALLNGLTTDQPETDKPVHVGAGGTAVVTVPMRSNDVVLVTLDKAQ